MNDVTVHNSSISTAHVTVDLGDGHKLILDVRYDTDRYRGVSVRWKHGRESEKLLGARLNLPEQTAVLVPVGAR